MLQEQDHGCEAVQHALAGAGGGTGIDSTKELNLTNMELTPITPKKSRYVCKSWLRPILWTCLGPRQVARPWHLPLASGSCVQAFHRGFASSSQLRTRQHLGNGGLRSSHAEPPAKACMVQTPPALGATQPAYAAQRLEMTFDGISTTAAMSLLCHSLRSAWS